MGASPLHDIRDRIGAGEVFASGTRASVPGPGHSKRDRSLSLVLGEGGRIVWHSFSNDDPAAVFAHLGIERQAARQIDRFEWTAQKRARERADAERRAADQRFCEQVWREGVVIVASPAEAYLRSRGLTGPFSLDLRFHPAAPRCKPRGPDQPPPPRPCAAMLAIVRDVHGRAMGLHATYLRPDGSGKAFNDRSRLMFGSVGGGAVRLAPLGDDGVLGVAEGIETALSFTALGGPPTWATLSTSGLSWFKAPVGLKKLMIAADGDHAGRRAATDLAERARRGTDVVVIAAPDGRDWNDELTGAPRG